MAKRVRTRTPAKRGTVGKARGRVAPNVPRAGFKANGSRYSCGGKLK